MLSRLFLAVALVVFLASAVQAQFGGNQRRGQGGAGAQMQPAEIEGVIERSMQGGILVLDDKNRQPWRVAIPQNAKVTVTGTAAADYLQADVCVEFEADVDDHGALKEKVDKLTIVTFSPQKQPGLFPPGSEDEGAGFDDGAGADAKPAKHGAAKGGAAKGTAAKGTAAKSAGKGKGGAIPAGSYRIVGSLKTARGGKFSVNTGRGMLPLELTSEPTITVKCSNYLLASKGDKASIKGMTMPNQAGLAQATEVKIELAEPLAGVKKKGAPAKGEAKRPAKRPKKEKDEGLPEPAADK